MHTYTTESQVRSAFWASHPQYTRVRGKRQNDYCADIRCAWVDYVDYLARSGEISESLADRVTL